MEQEANRQKRSLKSQLEHTIEECAMRLEEPSEEYTAMIDAMLAKLDKGELQFDAVEEIRAKYGL